MKFLGLDLGTKTLGLAISDALGMISSPYKTIRYNDYNELILELKKIIESENISKLIMGLPKNMNNTLGKRAEAVINFKDLLEKHIEIEIILVDERLSTMEAEKYLLEGDLRRNKRKKIIDSVAASIILDSYLRRKENGKWRN